MEDLHKFAKEENVRYLRLQFTDILGVIKNVEVPVSQLEKVLDNQMMFDGSSIEGFVRIEESDMYLYPDLDTWVIFPWTAGQGKVARLICDVYKDRKSTRLNSSHVSITYADSCLKKKNKRQHSNN